MAWRGLVPLGSCGLISSYWVTTAECQCLDSVPVDAELRLVHVLFRHGARTPLTEKYWQGVLWERGRECREAFEAVRLSLRLPDGGSASPSKYDQKQMSTRWPGGCMKGELTAGGQEQAKALGQWLHRRYVQQLRLLPQEYTAELLSCRTTNYARTRETLAGVITGLYPGIRQPVPATTSTDAEEILIGTAQSCESLAKSLRLQASRLRDTASRDAEVQELDAAVRTALDLPSDHRVSYTDVYDALTTLKYHQKGWPPGVTEQLYKRIELEAVKRMAAIVSPGSTDELGPEIMSLSVGQLISQMSQTMEAVVHEGVKLGTSPRLVLLSGHDTTIMPILVTLIGRDLDHWPGYLSNVVIELWQRRHAEPGEDSFFVRALYNQKELPLQGTAQGQDLSFAEFKAQHWQAYNLERPEYLQRCALELHHDAPAPQGASVGGDSVQGL